MENLGLHIQLFHILLEKYDGTILITYFQMHILSVNHHIVNITLDYVK